MINLSRFVKLTNVLSVTSRRTLSSKLNLSSPASVSLSQKQVYNEPLRYPTMDDLVEPYGPWKQAYAAENRKSNFALFRGATAFLITILIFCYSGVTDGLYMPNLDNIMEETEPFHTDKEDRVTV